MNNVQISLHSVYMIPVLINHMHNLQVKQQATNLCVSVNVQAIRLFIAGLLGGAMNHYD